MDKAKITEALRTIWVRVFRSTQTPISSGEVAELQNALRTVSDDKQVLGRRLLDFCEQVKLSEVTEARREPATRMENFVMTCESLQRQLMA